MLDLTDKTGRAFRVDPDHVTDIAAYADTSVTFPLTRLIVDNRAIFLARASAPQLLDQINDLRTEAPLTLGAYLVAPSGPQAPYYARRRAIRGIATLTPTEDRL